MTTVEFITALFYEVDEQMRTIPKHPEAHLWPSEVVALGLLHALKGRGQPCFYRWFGARLSAIVSPAPRAHPALSSLKTHQDWTRLSWPPRPARRHRHVWDRVDPSMREGRSPQQIGRKGLSNHRLDCRRQTLPFY